jgi:predicted dehydrogenase
MQRRTLLAGLGASITAASYARIAGANDRLGMALVGAGSRGRGVMKALVGTGGVDLTCLCDVYDVRRQEAQQALGKPDQKIFETAALEETLARKDVDAVLIATPDHLHHDYTIQALKAGKHVYLEKPTTHTLEEGDRLVAAVRKSGKVCQTGTQQRSGSHYVRAKEEIFAKKRLGHVMFVRTVWADFPRQRRKFDPAPKPAGLDWARFLGRAPKVGYHPMRYETWRYYPEYGGGLLADILTHWADVAQWMLDDASPLTATAGGGILALNDGRANPDTVNAIVEYKGWNLTFESTVLPAKVRANVLFLGTEGTLDIDRSGYTFTPHQGAPEVVKASGDLDAEHARNFVDAVKAGKTPSADIAIGVEACRPVHLAKAAYWKHRRMKFNGAKTAIVAA